MFARDTSFLARLMSGNMDEDRAALDIPGLSPIFQPVARRLLSALPRERPSIWDDFLAGRLRRDPIIPRPPTGSLVEPARRVRLTCAVDLEPCAIDWLWSGRVPLGMITMFAGDPKLGKSYVTLAMAAALFDFYAGEVQRIRVDLGDERSYDVAIGSGVVDELTAIEARTVVVLYDFAVVLQRQLAGYQYMLAIPALALAGAYGLVDMVRAVRAPDARLIAGAGLVAVTLFVAREGQAWWRAYAPDLDYLRGRLSRDTYLRTIQPGGFSMADEEQAGRWLHDHTAPGDGLLVWGLSPGIYALADRHPRAGQTQLVI